MQLWQQHLMYRQLQELQRQQQLQQLDQDSRQQNSSNQFSGVAKSAAADQLPLVVNGMPIHDIPNYAWKNEHMGNESKIPSGLQIFTARNMNWAQCRGTMPMPGFPNGLVLSQNQDQAVRSTGLVPQHPDQSLYGTPVSSNRNILNQYSQLPGVSNNSADMIAKSGYNQGEKQLMQSGVFHSFQSEQYVLPAQVCVQDGLPTRHISPAKALFSQVPTQNTNNGIMLENVPQLNPLGRSMQVQESQERQEQTDGSGDLQEKTVPQVGPSRGMSNLDPTEQKLLFGTDDESRWLGSSGRIGNMDSGGYLHRNLPEGTDHFNAFPSIQSGSWSALMQSAVAEASSSDTGLQDEWNELSFQQKEPSSGNHSTTFVGSGGQQTIENFQSASASTPRSFPLSDDADVNKKDHAAAMFCQSYVKSAYDHGLGVVAEASTSGLLDQNQLHQKVLEGVIQAQMHSGSVSSGGRLGQPYEQPLSTVPAEPKLNQRNSSGAWLNPQNMPLYNGSQNHGKVNALHVSELLPSGRDAILKANDHETTVHRSWMNYPKGAADMQRYREGNVWKSDGGLMSVSFPHLTGGFSTSGIGSLQVETGDPYVGGFIGVNLNNSSLEVNEKSVSGHQANHAKLVSADSSLESKGNDDVVKYKLQLEKDRILQESSVNLFEKASGVAYDKEMENSSQKEVSDGEHISDNSHSAQPNDSGGVRRQNSLLAGSDSSQSAGGNKIPSHQTGQRNPGPQIFYFQPMRNLEVDVELHTSEQNFYSQEQSQIIACGMKSQDEPELRQLQFGGHSTSNGSVDIDKQQLLESQSDMNASEEIGYRGRISVYDSDVPSVYDSDVPSSFQGSAANLAQNKSGQTSQNMLELLHKVDQSRDTSSVPNAGFSNYSMVPERPDKTSCDAASYLQNNQPSALQGIGLALPLKHQSILSHALSSQAVHHYNSRHFDLGAEGEKDQTSATPPVSVCTLPPLHGVSERENWDIKSNLSGMSIKETPRSNLQVFSPGISASMLPYARNQLQQLQQLQQWQQQQKISIARGGDLSVNMHSGTELDQDARSKSPLHVRAFSDLYGGAMHGEAVANPSGQQLLPGVSQIPPFKLACSSDGRSPITSHSYSTDIGQPQVMGTTFFPRTSSQVPGLERQSVSQPSMTPVTPQQVGFSAMLQNVWTNVSIQQHLSGNPPASVRPNLFQPVSSSTLDIKSWASQRPDDLGRRATSKFATYSINSQQFTYEKQLAGKGSSLQQNLPQQVDVAPPMSGTLKGQESVSQLASDGNSSVSLLPMVQLHQQDIGRTKLGQGPSLDKQTSHASLLNAALGHNFKLSDVQSQNYSLLQQLQAGKAVEADPSKWYGKRLRGDSGAHAQQVADKMPQNFIYGYNTESKVPLDNELCATGHQSSFPTDTKMLCFSSESIEDQNIARASQLIGSDFHSQDLTGFGLESPQNYSSSPGRISMPASLGVTQPKQIGPRMAPSWFEPYGKFKNGQTSAICNGLGRPPKAEKSAVPQFFLSKSSESVGVLSAMEQGNDSSHVRSFLHGSPTTTANEHSSSLYAPAIDIDHNLVPRPKKRKITSALLPWRKEITRGSDKVQNISMAELDWAQATKRLSEKVDDEAQMNGNGSSVLQARRRLVLTTRLMQQLLPALPMRSLAADAILEHESVTYLVARLALGDACGRISCSISDLHFSSVGRNMVSEKFKTTVGIREHFFQQVAEDYIGRACKLENDLSRLEKRALCLDIRVDCHDLERLSIMNRFAKFHGRSQAEEVGNSSISEAAPQKMFLQRHVTALSVPGNLPEGTTCVSL